MRKITAAINMTLDGVFDHTAGIPDAEIHQHYTELLQRSDAILYGRKTYELMEFWRTVLENPSEEKSMNDFASAIDKIPKIIFSRTLEDLDWDSAALARKALQEEVWEWKRQTGSDVLIGSRSLILQLLELDLIDEWQLCVYPVIAGSGSLLFEDISGRKPLKLAGTKVFTGGAVILYYIPVKSQP